VSMEIVQVGEAQVAAFAAALNEACKLLIPPGFTPPEGTILKVNAVNYMEADGTQHHVQMEQPFWFRPEVVASNDPANSDAYIVTARPEDGT
jgi:hypothetical protein